MLKYLIIQLDDTSVSFCHYKNDKMKKHLIGIETLRSALQWSMRENLNVQFLYPDYALPEEYKDLISSVDHVDIVSSACKDEETLDHADIVVLDSLDVLNNYQIIENQTYVIRTAFDKLFANVFTLESVLSNLERCNVVITDIETLTKDVEIRYSQLLEYLNEKILREYKSKHYVQLNILTDRIMLNNMNNCGAGYEVVSLAPNGKFYICPGFYIDDLNDIGDVESGLNVKNPQLFRLDHAPICRICDAWHCKRCIWQNRKSTLEVNTPSREQCVTAHLERNASRSLLLKLHNSGISSPIAEIPVISYLDPFEAFLKNN